MTRITVRCILRSIGESNTKNGKRQNIAVGENDIRWWDNRCAVEQGASHGRPDRFHHDLCTSWCTCGCGFEYRMNSQKPVRS